MISTDKSKVVAVWRGSGWDSLSEDLLFWSQDTKQKSKESCMHRRNVTLSAVPKLHNQNTIENQIHKTR